MKRESMKKRDTLTLIFLLVALTAVAQNNYSPCYTNNIKKGDLAFSQGKYQDARTYYVSAKQCAGGNPLEAQNKITACDAKIKEEGGSEKQEEFTVNGVTFKMVYIRGGMFAMGCTSEQESDCGETEWPVHQVTVDDYWIGETEVTQSLWKSVMGNNPSYFKGDNLPVEQVSFDNVQKFIKKLNDLTGKTFRLPTEAEWEYAARGGKKSYGYNYSGSQTSDDVAWYADNSNNKTHPVKGKLPNELGLYDMSGNVWEWCQDWFGKYSSSAQINPKGPSTGSLRAIRGGAWFNGEKGCQSFNHNGGNPNKPSSGVGFRLALEVN